MTTIIDEGAPSAKELVTPKTAAKKGNRSWVPPVGEAIKKEDGFTYRWTGIDRIASFLQQGWELVMASKGETTFVNGRDKIFGGVSLDTVVAKSDKVLMRMPEDMVKQRNDFYAQRASRQRTSIKEKVEEFTGGGVPLHGDVKAHDRTGPVRTIIE
jgi:hypothetical protein